MKNDQHDTFFARLIAPMLDQLRRIAHGTRGEQSVDDLKTEAWIAAQDVRDEIGDDVEADDDRLQAAVLSKLRKAFGKFVNRKMRFAVQLDHEKVGLDGEFVPNSVAASLSAPETYEPEVAILMKEDHTTRELAIADRFCEAVAYLRTLDNFDHDKRAIAGYLAIPPSVLESRLKRAEQMAGMQRSMFDGVEAIPRDFIPLPGRRKLSAIARTKRIILGCIMKRSRQLRLFSLIPALFDAH